MYRAKNGRFARVPFIVKIIIYGALTFLLVVMIYGLFTQETKSITEEVIVDRSEEMYESKISAKRVEVLETLRRCECQHDEKGNCIPGWQIVEASNGQISMGDFMWYRPTLQKYFQALYQTDLSHLDAGLLAWDELEGYSLDEVTERGLFEGEQLGLKPWRDWANCFRRHDLRDKIDFINSF